jgi:hypothetical protein
MLTSLEWQTLEQRRRISRVVMMYKIQHQLVDIDRDLYLRPGDSRTRGQHGFFQKRSNYDTLRNSFQRTAREWNHLPDTTVGASSIEEFRANLQNRLATPTSVNSFNCVIVKCLVVHSLGDISWVCLACVVPQNLNSRRRLLFYTGRRRRYNAVVRVIDCVFKISYRKTCTY